MSKDIYRFLEKKRDNDLEEEENRLFDRERIIALYSEDKRIIFKVKSFENFFRVIEILNLPYFYCQKGKVFFSYDKNIQYFWKNKKNKIIYESQNTLIFNKESFFGFHKNIKPNKIELNFYIDFCSPYYYFTEDENEKFFNTLNEDIINELKETRHFDEKKIIRLFGPKKNGKSSLIYYYFGTRHYIPLREMKDTDNLNNDDEEEINIKTNKNINLTEDDDKSNKSDNDDINLCDSKYFISQKYDNNLIKQSLESDDNIPLLDETMSESLTYINANESILKLIKKKAKAHTKLIFLEKEFKITENDSLGFLRSCYLNNDFYNSKKFTDEGKMKTLNYEFEGLFKSYRVYKLFITQFNDFFAGSVDIIQIGEFILNFMRKYNRNNNRYYIVLDSISYDLLDELKCFENKARSDKNCFIIELFKNENIQNLFYDNILEQKNESDELALYLSSYSNLNLVDDINNDDKTFLISYFGQNLFYYQKYKKWKTENNNRDNKDFLTEIIKETEKELLKDFTNEEEGKAFFRFIALNVLYKNNIEIKIIKKLNLDYFFIEKRKNKYKLTTLPFIKLILENYCHSPINSILHTEFFLKSDEYIRGGIIEDISKQEIKKIFKNNLKNNNDYQEVDLHRLLDNEIFSFYDEKTITKILDKKNSFQEIKKKYKEQNLKLKDKVTVFNLYQNAKHYDMGILYYGVLFLIQSTINKNLGKIEELIEFNSININYIVNKIMNLTGEKNIITNVYCYFVIVNMELIYECNISPVIQEIISKNNKNNASMIKSINNSKFGILYLGKDGKIYNNNNELITNIKIPDNKYELYTVFSKDIDEFNKNFNKKKDKIMSDLKNAKNLPNFIEKNKIDFYSQYYPKMEKQNKIIYYYEYPKYNESFFEIKNKYYDQNFNKISDRNLFIIEHKSDRKIIMLFNY